MDARRMDIVTETPQAKVSPKPENHSWLRPMREVCVLQPWPAPSPVTPVQPERACVRISGAPLGASAPAPCAAWPEPATCPASDDPWQSPEPQDIPPEDLPRPIEQEAVPPLAQPLPAPARRPSAYQPQAPQAHAATGEGKPALPVSPEAVIAQKRDALEQRQTIRDFLLKLAVIAAMGCLLFTRVFGFATMTGEQMYPRVRDGDLMLYYRLANDYAIGDVLTFVRDGTRYTGRVVARGGDTVSMNDVGQLLVNDNVQTEEIFYPTTVTETERIRFPLVIPEHGYFLLCDMRTQATDSRVYGAVAQSEIEGKVISVLRRRGI